MIGHEKNEDRFRVHEVGLGLEHVGPNHLDSAVDHEVDLHPEGVLDLIPPVVEDEVQLCVVVGVDRDHVLHQVEDLLVQEVADDMVSMIDHLHTDRPGGILVSTAKISALLHQQTIILPTVIRLWVRKAHRCEDTVALQVLWAR